VYVYEQQQNNLFVHHEIMMSAFPLDIEWLNVDLGTINQPVANRGNYAIVSTFLPEIEIWDLDLADAIEPTLTLGG
jgi:periodic tryptophan protein 1